jgi:hypothetical protein
VEHARACQQVIDVPARGYSELPLTGRTCRASVTTLALIAGNGQIGQIGQPAR